MSRCAHQCVLITVPCSQYPGATQILLTGWGSGAYGAALWAAQYLRKFPSTKLTYFGDSAVDGLNYTQV